MTDNNKNVRLLVALLYALMFIFMFGVPFALIMYLPVSHWTMIGFLDRWLGSACVGMICSISAIVLGKRWNCYPEN